MNDREWEELDLPEPSLEELINGMHDETTDSVRPFAGQPHTNFGERGKTEIRGLRFRDLCDCVAKALVDAAGHTVAEEEDELRRRAEDGTLNYNDLFKLDTGGMDPVALIQCIGCRVEKFMGIFPNVPGLESDG